MKQLQEDFSLHEHISNARDVLIAPTAKKSPLVNYETVIRTEIRAPSNIHSFSRRVRAEQENKYLRILETQKVILKTLLVRAC